MTMFKNIIANFNKYSFLMGQLILRDFKVKYKRSVLGVVWSLLYPILMMSVMAIVFSQMFRFQVEGVSYLVYLMTGIIMFNYFSEASNNAMVSVVYNFGLINKVYIPKYIFPLAKCIFVGRTSSINKFILFDITIYLLLFILIYSRSRILNIMSISILKRRILYIWNYLNNLELLYSSIL